MAKKDQLQEKITPELLRKAKEYGFSDKQLSYIWGVEESTVRMLRKKWGIPPVFKPSKIEIGKTYKETLKKATDSVLKSFRRHLKLTRDPEFSKHGGMVINLDLTLQQEKYQIEELGDMIKN